jgi:hypothetical protein
MRASSPDFDPNEEAGSEFTSGAKILDDVAQIPPLKKCFDIDSPGFSCLQRQPPDAPEFWRDSNRSQLKARDKTGSLLLGDDGTLAVFRAGSARIASVEPRARSLACEGLQHSEYRP